MRDKLKTAKPVSLLVIALTFLFVFSSLVSAIYFPLPRIKGETVATPSAQAKGKTRDKLKNRLTEVKLKVCKKKESVIKKRSTKLVQRAENIQSRFDRIVTRADEFYVEKVVPKAGEIKGYGKLLDRIEETRAAVASSLGLAKSSANNFNCEGINPKEQIKQFRSDMQVVIIALKDYKKAVIDLLVAVKTKGKNIKTPTATESAEPTTGPTEQY